MSHKKLIASSLTICSASATWAMGTTNSPLVLAEDLQNSKVDLRKELIAQEALVQYLSPITAVADGNLAAKIETKPLTYEVKAGDTLFQIGQFFGMDYHVLAKYNRLKDPYQLRVGQKLNIPILKKWIRVKMGETIESLAEKYKTSDQLIKHLNPELKQSNLIFVGQLIAVPQSLDIFKTHQLSDETEDRHKAKVLPIRQQNDEAVMNLQVSERKESYVFRWPVVGTLTSKYGWRNGRPHKGIDIWHAARSHTPIHSALHGVVTRAGYSSSYGNLVVIDHGNGWVTYYAHLSRILVSKGQKVTTGQILGMMGKTGDATGYHLHFEIRKNGQAINPLSLLN
ncbi:M23 family metallopeptidase [Thermoflavimicrobium daqui]|jgi:murein DD-endopeptidase MepM/ murein hydrolase activator NlpD|uniref:LysM domain-containing protein n=1 Tax=Thermoflavimicrobium daqui TaxID=2137476 RepID=A0A364K3E9_9BACL|nr:M23 family metallopeptidase [Thermoflavimicrobium daqui]RAL23334.1 hypothetical protein DL897_11615 [Thermoflavimicrobium daqui]